MFSSFTKPFTAVCERNKAPILEALLKYMPEYVGTTVLEIGSGTGQHAVHFAAALPSVTWLPTDTIEHLPGITAWVVDAEIPNLREPKLLDVTNPQNWKKLRKEESAIRVAFTANTMHIIPWDGIVKLFQEVKETIDAGQNDSTPGRFFVYGPMNYNNKYTSEGNRKLDEYLKDEYGDKAGIRDIQDIVNIASTEASLHLEADITMPSNNRLLCFSTSKVV
eukprot:CFRG0788T1